MKKQMPVFGAGLLGSIIFCALFSLQWIFLGVRPDPVGYLLPFAAGLVMGMVVFRLKRKWEADASRRETDRLEAVQKLSGTMCHEMNQPLQTLVGQMNILKLELPESGPCRIILERMERDIFRIKEISRRLDGLRNCRTRPDLSDSSMDKHRSSGDPYGN